MRGAVEIRVGLGSCGVASGANAVRSALDDAAAGRIVVKAVGCNGMCYREPIVEVIDADGQSILYGNVNVETARQIARRHIPSKLPRFRPRTRCQQDSAGPAPAKASSA